jgi:LysM repeat protein
VAGSELYVVKSGDVLYNIARSHGTSVRALRSANNLKNDRIVVGQKLKIPSKSVTPASAPTLPASADNPPVTPVMSSGPTPTPTTHM